MDKLVATMIFIFATNNDNFYERSGFLKTVLGSHLLSSLFYQPTNEE